MIIKASFIYLFISSIFSQNTNAFSPSKNFIDGHVYFDENKNSIKNDYERGVSGVRLYLSSGQSILTDEQGHYSFEVKHLNKTSHIFIDQDSLPAGSVFTTPNKHNYSSQKQYALRLDFGIHYEKEDTVLAKETNTKGLFLLNPRKYKVSLNYSQQGLLIGDKLLFTHQELSQKRPRLEKLTLKIHPTLKKFNDESIKRLAIFLKNESENILSHKIIIPKQYAQGNQQLIDDLFTHLTQYGIKNVKIKLSTDNVSDFEINFSLKYNLACSYQVDSLQGEIQYNEKRQILIPIKKNQTINLNCHNIEKKISVPYTEIKNIKRGLTSIHKLVSNFSQKDITFVTSINEYNDLQRTEKITLNLKEQSYNFNVKNNNGNVFIYELIIKKSSLFNSSGHKGQTREFIITSPKYLQYSRDFENHFEFTDPENHSLEVNGRTLRPQQGHSSMIIHSERGLNTLTIKRNNQSYNYHYHIMEEPIFEASLKTGFTNTNRSVSDINIEYSLGQVQQVELNFTYFPLYQSQREWGLELRRTQNTKGVTYTLNEGTPIIKKQTETNISLLKRFEFRPAHYRTVKYLLGLGYYSKKTTGRSDVTLFIPKDFTGVSANLNLLWENVYSENIDLSLRNLAVININKPKNYIFKTTAELYYNLNDLGALFGLHSIYSSYYRYDYLKNIDFTFSLGYENSKNTLINSPRGSIVENNISFWSGILWRY